MQQDAAFEGENALRFAQDAKRRPRDRRDRRGDHHPFGRVRAVRFDDLMKAGHDGTLQEAFGTGTAAVISPIGELRYKDDEVTINDFKTGELTQKLYDTLTGIQWGNVEDTFGWTKEVK